MIPEEQHSQYDYERVTNDTKKGVIHHLKSKPYEGYAGENAC